MMKAFLFGLIFGAIAQRSRINAFDTIGGFAMRKDFMAAKALLTAIGVGSVLFFLEVQLGWASLDMKPFAVTGVVAGGAIFGIGMAVLGYCPGTLAVSIGEGAIDALVGLVGGLTAGLVYIMIYPRIANFLGPDLGKINLYAESSAATALIVIVFGTACVAAAILIHKRETPHVDINR